MFRACSVALAVLMTSAGWSVAARAADPPRRKPLDQGQRTALLALLNAVDAAQRVGDAGDPSAEDVSWDSHVLKAQHGLAYVPFRLTLIGGTAAPAMKSVAMYVRAVSRHEGFRTADEHSRVRDWLTRGGDAPAPRQETIFIGPGEMPVGGPASSSARRSVHHLADGVRRLFNRTPTQELTDDNLPPVSPWETQAFTSQSLGLRPFAPGKYELEVTVRDRLTRGTAKQSVMFSVR